MLHQSNIELPEGVKQEVTEKGVRLVREDKFGSYRSAYIWIENHPKWGALYFYTLHEFRHSQEAQIFRSDCFNAKLAYEATFKHLAAQTLAEHNADQDADVNAHPVHVRPIFVALRDANTRHELEKMRIPHRVQDFNRTHAVAENAQEAYDQAMCGVELEAV